MPPKWELFKAFIRHPYRFTRTFVVGVTYARAYEKAVGKKLKDM